MVKIPVSEHEFVVATIVTLNLIRDGCLESNNDHSSEYAAVEDMIADYPEKKQAEIREEAEVATGDYKQKM